MKNGKTKEEIDIKDFDEILEYIGGWGPFQYLLTLIFFPFNIFLGYVLLSPILTLFTPPHWCLVPELANLTREERKLLAIPPDTKVAGEFSQCSQYVVDWSKILSGNISQSDPSWSVGKCTDGWEYEIEDYHKSITTDFDWVCDNAWIPALSQTAFFFGAIPGMLILGWLSDTYGRLPTIIISNIIALVSGMATPFVTGHVAFIVLRFCMGLSFYTFFLVPYVLVMEYVEGSKRTLVGNLGLATCLTLSGVYQPWVMKFLGDWKLFNWIMFSQMGLIVVVPFILPESCRWLISKGEGDKSVKVMKKIAKMNKKEVPDRVYDAVLKMCLKQKQLNESMPSYTYLDLFRTPNMRKITILISILYMLIALEFDTTVRNISNLNFNIYMSFMISGALELPADLLSILGLNYLGRRWSSSISLFACGITILPCAWLADHWEAQAVFAMTARFWATYAMNTGMQFSVEVMPTQLRGQGTALVNVMSMVSQMASPYIVYSSVVSEKAPFIILGIIGIFSAIPGLFLPETADVKFPETLEDAEIFGKNDRFFWMPLCGSASRYKKQQNTQEVGSPTDNVAFSAL